MIGREHRESDFWSLLSLGFNSGDTGMFTPVEPPKNMFAMRETWVQSLGQEHPLEKGMDTHSSISTWRILWTEEPGRLQSMGLQRVGHK